MDVARLRRHARELGFTPRDQVRWLSPGELWRTAVKVTLSSVFADYADRREVQAALPSPELAVRPDAGELWFDYVCDLGDGFDSTYTVACLIAEERLRVAAPGEAPVDLPRAPLLVLGGDAVYPTPSAAAYEDRTKGPYRAALPESEHDGAPPVLLALPGNHDWYDGLSAFLRIFAQRRHVGAWRTVQTRSYFAVRLPNRWWLVGVDTQLGTYIDDPQIRYFREHLSCRLQPGDGVIVASPSPTWVHVGEGRTDAFDSLHWFERQVVERHVDVDSGRSRPTGARVRLWLSGDRHHYARYAEDVRPAGAGDHDDPSHVDVADARQLVTCGLGGSYLMDTHRLPQRLVLPPPDSRVPGGARAAFDLEARWPPAEASRRLVAGLVTPTPRGLPFRNPGFWRLAGAVQAHLLLVLAFVLGLGHGLSPIGVLRRSTPGDVLGLAGTFLVWGGVALLLWCLAPLVRRRRPRPPSDLVLLAAGQLAVALVTLALAVAVPWPSGWPQWLVLGSAVLGAWFGAGLVASFVVAAWILGSRRPTVQSWQASAQSVEDGKGFVRVHIRPDGGLTLYPVLVERVCHDWELEPVPASGGRPDGVRPVPRGGLPAARLVEAPVSVTRTPRG